jgi:hypothetical protein
MDWPALCSIFLRTALSGTCEARSLTLTAATKSSTTWRLGEGLGSIADGRAPGIILCERDAEAEEGIVEQCAGQVFP